MSVTAVGPDEASITENHGAQVKSAYRTIEVLELLAARPRRLTLSEIQRELHVPKSSLHGLLQTLVRRGWVDTDERGTDYGIGLRALRIGASYLEHDPVVEAAGSLLVRLRDELDETVHLARLDGPDIVYLASRESTHHLRTSSRIGRRLPAHATSLGKALLATLSDNQVDALLPDHLVALTENTVTSRTELLAELAETRLRGWSYEEGQNTPGLGCVAVAVPSRHPARDALSCSIPLVRLTDTHRNQIAEALNRAAEQLARVAGTPAW